MDHATATGTVHRLSVLAPQMISAAAIGRRIRNGIGTYGIGGGVPKLWVAKRMKSSQSRGPRMTETTMTASVAPAPIARDRHSRRAANQSRPIPGDSLVKIGNAHRAGHRKPSTQ